MVSITMNQNVKISCLMLLLFTNLSACQTISKTASKAGSMIGLGDKAKVPEIDAKGVVDISKTTLEQIQQLTLNMPTGQWVYIENDLQGIYSLQNKSKDGFLLFLKLNCKIPSQQATFNIQNASGQEILRAHDDSIGSIQFLLDNKNYGNPFSEINPKKLETFKTDLKKTKVLKIFNASKLYTFQNDKSELLDKSVTCKD